MNRFRPGIVVAMLALIATAIYAAVPAERTPVLVELFTSEGCSSCPPADDLLTQLAKQQPVAGVEIIAMSEHVDYWNSLGWKDPFSASQFTERQDEYRKAFDHADSYTPQMIIDGQTEFLGSDKGQAIQAASRASRTLKTAVTISRTAIDANSIKLQVRMNALPGVAQNEAADVYLAVTENNLASKVTRGEDEGRQLLHVAVVRKLTLIGHASESGAFAADPVVRLASQWKLPELRAVVFVQAKKARNVLAAASIPLIN